VDPDLRGPDDTEEDNNSSAHLAQS
jgi:hypothetical protein